MAGLLIVTVNSKASSARHESNAAALSNACSPCLWLLAHAPDTSHCPGSSSPRHRCCSACCGCCSACCGRAWSACQCQSATASQEHGFQVLGGRCQRQLQGGVCVHVVWHGPLQGGCWVGPCNNHGVFCTHTGGWSPCVLPVGTRRVGLTTLTVFRL